MVFDCTRIYNAFIYAFLIQKQNYVGLFIIIYLFCNRIYYTVYIVKIFCPCSISSKAHCTYTEGNRRQNWCHAAPRKRLTQWNPNSNPSDYKVLRIEIITKPPSRSQVVFWKLQLQRPPASNISAARPAGFAVNCLISTCARSKDYAYDLLHALVRSFDSFSKRQSFPFCNSRLQKVPCGMLSKLLLTATSSALVSSASLLKMSHHVSSCLIKSSDFSSLWFSAGRRSTRLTYSLVRLTVVYCSLAAQLLIKYQSEAGECLSSDAVLQDFRKFKCQWHWELTIEWTLRFTKTSIIIKILWF